MVTTIGSLPHVEVDGAVRFALDAAHDLPAAPQLPRRSRLEGMLAQVAVGIPGVRVTAAGGLAVEGSLRAPGRVPDRGGGAGALDPEAHGGALAFLRAAGLRAAGLRAAALRAAAGQGEAASGGLGGPVKLQLTGPVTLALALVDAGADPSVAALVAREAVRRVGAGLVAAARAALPGCGLTVWLDEPGLVRHRPGPFDGPGLSGLLAGGLEALGPGVVTGVHCCGATDWGPVVAAGPDVLSLPVDAVGAVGDAPDAGGALARHLAGGGWVAWGAVPTDRPVSAPDEGALWDRLVTTWALLATAGCDPDRLRRQALVTPVCGLAGLDLAAAGTVVELTVALGRRVAALTPLRAPATETELPRLGRQRARRL